MGLIRRLIKLLIVTLAHKTKTYTRPIRRRGPIAARLLRPATEPPWKVVEQTRPQIIKGRCRVVDGDTIVINKISIRLAGIDAPELDHPYGQVAKRALMALCRDQIVTAVTDGSTTYERAVAVCTLDDGRDLAAEMVKAGLALDWAKYSGGRYRRLEADGIRKKLWRVEAKHRGKMPPQDMNPRP